MSNPYDMIIQQLKDRNTADYNKFPPFFIASAGAHYFNLINQGTRIWTEAGMTVNTRLHIIMVAPQGQSKSFWLKQFLEHDNSMLKGTMIQTDFELRMSEAGYLGTIKFAENNQIIETQGLCQEEANSIVGIEEFSDLMKSVTAQDYNIGLENELLTTLDSGMAIKRLAAGKLEYRTNLTLWTATQPARYNLTSGLGRRFLFIFNIPTEESMQVLKRKRREASDVQVDESDMFEIKKTINSTFNEMTQKVHKIRFEPSFYNYLDRLNIVSYEEPLYERLALGYTIMKSEGFESELVIDADSTLKKMMKMEWGWRKKIKSGTEESMVWSLIESSQDLKHERCLEILMDFGMDIKDARKSLRTLEKRGLIDIKDDKIKIKKEKDIIYEPEEMQQEIIDA